MAGELVSAPLQCLDLDPLDAVSPSSAGRHSGWRAGAVERPAARAGALYAGRLLPSALVQAGGDVQLQALPRGSLQALVPVVRTRALLHSLSLPLEP